MRHADEGSVPQLRLRQWSGRSTARNGSFRRSLHGTECRHLGLRPPKTPPAGSVSPYHCLIDTEMEKSRERGTNGGRVNRSYEEIDDVSNSAARKAFFFAIRNQRGRPTPTRPGISMNPGKCRGGGRGMKRNCDMNAARRASAP